MPYRILADARGPNFASTAFVTAMLLTFAGSGYTEDDIQPLRSPNIILMMADDLGWGDPQCFNEASPIQTPNLDAMAANGLKFLRFYSAAPVCSPTRGSCLTGRHPYRYGIYSANVGHIPAEEITLPETLRGIGYSTGHFGKWHLGTLTKEIKDANRGGPRGKEHYAPPAEHGYDVCLATESKVPTYDPLLQPLNAPATAWDALTNKQNGISYGTRYWDETGKSIEDLEGADSAIIMDAALKFISRAVDSEKPFFTTIWFHAPHLPVVGDPNYVKLYSQYDVYHRNYFGCITSLDAQIGRLRTALRGMGIEKDTMVWFCSDNGPEGKAGDAPGSAGTLRGRKRDLYEGGVRVPAILEWPGTVTPRSTNVPAVTSDYLPTLYAYLGLTLPTSEIDGISLRPMIEQKVDHRGRPIFFQSAKQQSMVTDRYKLISINQGKSWELFDLRDDAEEKTNLASQLPEIVDLMQRELQKWIDSCE